MIGAGKRALGQRTLTVTETTTTAIFFLFFFSNLIPPEKEWLADER